MSSALSSLGSSTCTTWNRRVSAGSFSMYFLYSLHVVAAMVRRVPRASAGFRRLAASPVPAAPPAPIRVWASSMNRMIGFGEACTSSMTERSRFSNSPFMLAPAWSRPMSSAQSCTSLSAGGTSPSAMRSAKPSTTAVLPDPGLAGEDRVVLPPAHQDVDDLPDLLVAAGDGIDVARARPRRQVGGEAPERLLLAHGRRRDGAGSPRRARPAAKPSLAARPSSGEPLTMRAKSSVSVSTLTLSNSREIREQHLAQAVGLEEPDQQVAAAHLRLAEQEGRVHPALLDRVRARARRSPRWPRRRAAAARAWPGDRARAGRCRSRSGAGCGAGPSPGRLTI